MLTTPAMGLTAWNSPTDIYDSDQLAINWTKVDQHDHSPGKGIPVPTAGIANGAITSDKFAVDAFASLDIPDNSVSTAKLVDSAVTTIKINDAAVTNAKLATNSVALANMQDNSVGTAEIVPAAVTATEIAPNAVGTSEIAAGAVGASELGSASVTSAKLGPLSVTTAALGAGVVTNAKLGDNSVTAPKLALGFGQTGLSVDLDLGGSLSTWEDLASLTPNAATYLFIGSVYMTGTTTTDEDVVLRFLIGGTPTATLGRITVPHDDNAFLTVTYIDSVNGSQLVKLQAATSASLLDPIVAKQDQTGITRLQIGGP
jgi:hypothetical protein